MTENFIDILTKPFENGPEVKPGEALIRLLLALALGVGVAWVYRHTRKDTDIAASFPTTLVLLSVLIAMVTQVIGDNVARAFSLVGALAIVRFRTVVRDTQDTAYVIFAVVVGMAVGAKNLWIAVLGFGVVGLAAWAMSTRARKFSGSQPVYQLSLRIGVGHEVDTDIHHLLESHLDGLELISIATARQGISLDKTYETRLRSGASPDELVKALNRVEGIQNVQLERKVFMT